MKSISDRNADTSELEKAIKIAEEEKS